MEIFDYIPNSGDNVRLEWKPTVLIPVSDVQFGSEACSADMFKRWIQRLLKEYADWQVLFLGLGDYTDSIRPSLRKKYLASDLNEDEHFVRAIQDEVRNHINGFLKLVSGTEGKWIGLLEGHHYFDYGNGETSDTKLAHRLNTRFLGDCTMFNLIFNRSGHRNKFTIWAHHGEGGGQLSGAPLNKLEDKLKTFDADCFLMAHQHKAVTAKKPFLYLDNSQGQPKLVHKDRSITGTGGWLQGYMQGSQSGNRAGGYYPEQRMLTPVSLGGCRIHIFPKHSGSRDWIEHEIVV